MSPEQALVLLFVLAPVALVLIVAMVRGYTIIVQFIRRDRGRNGNGH